MGVLSDITVSITKDDVLGGRRRQSSAARLAPAAEEAIGQARALWQPRAVYQSFDVLAVEEESACIRGSGGPVSLRIGPHAELLAPARQAVIAVGTIGPELEEQVDALSGSGRALDALLLDNAGVVAIGAIGERLRRLVESMAPGSLVGWSVHEQSTLCGLLPLERIGVKVTGYGVLQPLKSASWLIGIGPDYASRHVGSMCHLCALSETCWRRVEEKA